ncbi:MULTISPECIES: hypothetical protein [Halorussus]|uniref:hypothetical protein n=1 Tax=Halorussus TaxID=1070314 RepID=UPI0020A1CA3C|nr:hypothetical protein [Halorussus vallis]USZ77769.1 hypothetical protein NGM07_21545 [Halorussus vallis]
MIEFELKSMSYGWYGSDVPDNIEFVIRTEDGRQYDMSASLQQLAVLYDSIVNRAARNFFIGAGTSVEVQDLGEKLKVQMGRTTLTGSESLLRERIEHLLKGVFKNADQEDPSARERNLHQINNHLQEFYGGFDFESLYQSLSSGN